MKTPRIWMAVVHDGQRVVFSRACRSESKARKAVVDSLRQHHGFKGRAFDQVHAWLGEKNQPLKVFVFAMHPGDFEEVWDVLPVFREDLPLREKGLYRVIYEIDVGAESAIEAAKTVHDLMMDSDSMPPVLDVIDHQGSQIRIDLSRRTLKGHQPCRR